MHWRMRPWVRRLITRTVAILPRCLHHRPAWRGECYRALDVEPGCAGTPTPVCNVPLLMFASPATDGAMGGTAGFLAVAGWSSALLITADVSLASRLPQDSLASSCRITPGHKKGSKRMYGDNSCYPGRHFHGWRDHRTHQETAQGDNSRIVLLHVADGWAARTFGPDAISPEIVRGPGVPRTGEVGIGV